MQFFVCSRVNIGSDGGSPDPAGPRCRIDLAEDNVIGDEDVSGVSTRFAEREGGRRLLDKLRPGDVLVVRRLDRLGCNYDDVRDTVQVLMRGGE